MADNFKECKHGYYLDTSAVTGDETVEHPKHYTSGGIETSEYIRSWGFDFFEGNVVKYITRWRRKHEDPSAQLCDLRKAKWYLERIMEHAERQTRIGDGNGTSLAENK